MSEDLLLDGPPIYRNWRRSITGAPSEGAYEVPLFTDAHIVGEIREGYGPYQFLNPVTLGETPGTLLPAIVLRAEDHAGWKETDPFKAMSQTNASHYHGGWITDEVAALVSLCLGIRCRAGGISREFKPKADPRGRPIAHDHPQEPILLPWPLYSNQRLVIPYAAGAHFLDHLAPIQSLPLLDPTGAVALVRAARQYQHGLWVVETEPALAWLLMVSAVETVAQCWRATDDPIERMVVSQPRVVELLRASGGESLLRRVAELMAPYMGATSKFVSFLLQFLPDAPTSRPGEVGRIAWETKSLKSILTTIYDYRSKALHSGTPFPAPMCDRPFRLTDTEAYVEKPIGLAAGTLGSTWLAKDTPILLHTFERIARGAILRWWKSQVASHAASQGLRALGTSTGEVGDPGG